MVVSGAASASFITRTRQGGSKPGAARVESVGETLRYTQGEYLTRNPDWHVEDAPWKTEQIVRMLERNRLRPRTVCDVGCGAGEILRQLRHLLDPDTRLVGYEISPQALALARSRPAEGVTFVHGTVRDISEPVDLALVIDVIEHLEDYFAFLRELRPRAEYKLFHVPLELSAQAVLRQKPLLANRRRVGHLHHFTKDLVLELLADVGYEAVDWFYTLWSIERPPKSWRERLARGPRRIAFAVQADLAARTLGGASLLVLAR